MVSARQFSARRSNPHQGVVCGLLALAFSSVPALADGGVAIEFSAPKSDAVISNILEKSRSTGSVLDEFDDDIFSPLFRQDSPGSLGPVLTSPSRRAVVPSRRVRESQDEKRNWLMMNPEEYLRRSSGARDRGFSEENTSGEDEPELTIVERYYLEMRERESRPAPRSPASPQGLLPIFGDKSESGSTENLDQLLNNLGQSSSPLLDLFPIEEVGIIANQFGDALMTDPRRLGGAFSQNLVGDPMRRERLHSFQQLLQPDHEVASPLNSLQEMLNPGASLNPSLGQSSGRDGLLSFPEMNSAPVPGIEPMNQPDHLNSAFTSPDPFGSESMQDPNIHAFGGTPGMNEPVVEPRSRASFAPLVLPRPQRDF